VILLDIPTKVPHRSAQKYAINSGAKVSSQQSDPELTHYLQDIKNRLEDQIIRYFFKLVKDLPAQFLFPMLDFNDFEDSLKNGKDFTQEQEYQIHRARTRHNSVLKRVSENLQIPTLTGHLSRHTLATTWLMVVIRKKRSDKYLATQTSVLQRFI
jgi:integrase